MVANLGWKCGYERRTVCAGTGGDFGCLNDRRLQRSFSHTKWVVAHSDNFLSCGNLNVKSVVRMMGRMEWGEVGKLDVGVEM